MFIQTESTPNPATLKFLPGQTVLEMGTADFPSADTAGTSPLASRVFAVDGVTGVFLGNDFVTVTKSDASDWDHIKPAILGAVMEHFQSGQPAIDGDGAGSGGHAEHSGEDGAIVDQIKELLDTRVRPAVAQDGGDSRAISRASASPSVPRAGWPCRLASPPSASAPCTPWPTRPRNPPSRWPFSMRAKAISIAKPSTRVACP